MKEEEEGEGEPITAEVEIEAETEEADARLEATDRLQTKQPQKWKRIERQSPARAVAARHRPDWRHQMPPLYSERYAQPTNRTPRTRSASKHDTHKHTNTDQLNTTTDNKTQVKHKKANRSTDH